MMFLVETLQQDVQDMEFATVLEGLMRHSRMYLNKLFICHKLPLAVSLFIDDRGMTTTLSQPHDDVVDILCLQTTVFIVEHLSVLFSLLEDDIIEFLLLWRHGQVEDEFSLWRQVHVDFLLCSSQEEWRQNLSECIDEVLSVLFLFGLREIKPIG